MSKGKVAYRQGDRTIIVTNYLIRNGGWEIVGMNRQLPTSTPKTGPFHTDGSDLGLTAIYILIMVEQDGYQRNNSLKLTSNAWKANMSAATPRTTTSPPARRSSSSTGSATVWCDSGRHTLDYKAKVERRKKKKMWARNLGL